jgi:hypothetical protein
MQIVPLQAVPSQAVSITLGGQYCQLNVYQTAFGLFMDVYSSNTLVIGGVLCENLNLIVRSEYLGFIGDFGFIDTQSSLGTDPVDSKTYVIGTNPVYTGLGAQYQLAYLSASDVTALNLPLGVS